MTKEQVDKYIIETTNEFPELKEINDNIHIKWDGMPYPLREYIFSLPNYDKHLMIEVERDCGCGSAYFYQAENFYLYLKNWNGPKI